MQNACNGSLYNFYYQICQFLDVFNLKGDGNVAIK